MRNASIIFLSTFAFFLICNFRLANDTDAIKEETDFSETKWARPSVYGGYDINLVK